MGARFTRFVRGLQRRSLEGEHLRHYMQPKLTKGRYLLDIHTPPLMAGERTLGVLRRHRAHFINTYH
jgi:hypothetical protein